MTIDNFRDKYAFLSNFYQTPIWVDGECYPSVEHAFQAAKTHNQGDKKAIREAYTASTAKKIGRSVTLRDDWEAVKDGVMFELLCAKFSSERWLADMLVETGSERLVEGNHWNDTYWGVCNGVGQNKLGELLMLVRSLIVLERS